MQTLRKISQVCRLRIFGTRHYASPFETPVYEIRFYQMKPEKYRESLDLLAKYWHVRCAYSRAIGSWMSEVGGICETVHIWEYASLKDRMDRRDKVAKDEVWTQQCLPKFFADSHKHTNALVTLIPETRLITRVRPSDKAIYELKNYYVNGQRGDRDEGEHVIGHFTTLFGATPTEYTLLRYTDADEAFEKALKRRHSQGTRGYSRLMVPCRWSAMK